MSLYFSELYEQDFQIRDIFLMVQTFWRKTGGYRTKEPRPTDALLYFEDAECRCYPKNGTPFLAAKGDLVYIPRGGEYHWEVTEGAPREPITWLFNFTLQDAEGRALTLGDQVQILGPEKPALCRMLFESLLREGLRPRPFPAALRGQAYALLAEVIKAHYRREAEGIYEGIRYLENDIAQEKSIEEIAGMCHMSLSSFEKQFKAYSGTTPRDFRLECRLERAELLLRNTTIPIHRIAEELGFYDAAAFCKLFKKKKGLSPSVLRK